jgi:hypothetical protein
MTAATTKLSSSKIRRPKNFRGKSPLASLIFGSSPIKGIQPRRASPSDLFLKNHIPDHFKETPCAFHASPF